MERPSMMMLDEPHQPSRHEMANHGEQVSSHHYTTRQSAGMEIPPSAAGNRPAEAEGAESYSQMPQPAGPKNVTFELHFDGASSYRGRLPMRVQIFPHDTTESIVTTVQNFYGLYDGLAGSISFEDSHGRPLIARYDNLTNDMNIYVRVVATYHQAPEMANPWQREDGSQVMLPPQPAQMLTYGQPPSRPGSRISRKQSASPRMGKASRSRSGIKSHGSSFQAGLDELNGDAQQNSLSDSDGGAASVTSSRKARSEQLASAEISVDNIVEGGRRKRAKFDSSELPLFVPPQVPAPNSISSISPQRRVAGQDAFSPFARPIQKTFAYALPLPSPQSATFGDRAQPAPSPNTPFPVPLAHGHRLRDRASCSSVPSRTPSGTLPRRNGFGILPTPDPTVASCISDEDVALQLMRLGDASNLSHGRTSASTLDDALSGRAETASSVTSNSDDDSEGTEQATLPPHHLKMEASVEPPALAMKKHRKYLDHVGVDRSEPSGDEVERSVHEPATKSDLDDPTNVSHTKTKGRPKTTPLHHKVRGTSASTKSSKSSKAISSLKKIKPTLAIATQPALLSTTALPASATMLTPATLYFQQNLAGTDEDDLSSKPRCQRCRKSKKGCDRQRPCQRCVDAGIGIDGCVSEDEGNGRKGRYGRHMGVPIKRTDEQTEEGEERVAGAILTGMAGGVATGKKRKRQLT